MPSVRTVDEVWRGKDPEFSFTSNEGEKVTLVSTGINFTDDSLGMVYCQPQNADEVMQQLQHLVGNECEFVLEEAKPTKKGKTKWKVKEFPGKRGSACRILSEASGDAQGDWGSSPAAAPDDEVGGVGGPATQSGNPTPPDPVAAVKQAFDADTVWADEDDWLVAVETFGTKSRAAIRVAYRKKYGKSIADAYGDADKLPLDVLEELMAEA
jgi:hypothetical protein